MTEKSLEKTIPAVAVRDSALFPFVSVPLSFGRPQSTAAVKAAFEGKNKRFLAVFAQKDPLVEEPKESDLFPVGVLVALENFLEAEGMVTVVARAIARVRFKEMVSRKPYLLVKIEDIPDVVEKDSKIKILSAHLLSEFRKAFNLGKQIDMSVLMRLSSGSVSPSELSYQIAATLELNSKERQELLEEVSVSKRLKKVVYYLSREIKVLELDRSISSKTQARFEKEMKEAVLREKKKAIEEQLGELSGREEDERAAEFRKRIKSAGMPPKVRKKAEKELERFIQIPPVSPERPYLDNWLDWVTSMPWSKKTPDKTSISRAAKILEEDHFGLEKVKERIVEYLAVMKLKQKNGRRKKGKKEEEVSGPTILCFMGPPGVGKTSIGKSIARALGREFIRVSLGGIRDEAEIRGHRRTYVGALPGRIIQGIKSAGTKNPVFMLDEIDKLGHDFRGDPSSALLEALDPEQNREFSDHYLEVPFDLSEVMFICTGNVLETIPPALRDRTEVIRFSGYTQDEKFHIAKKFLWPKQVKAHGLSKPQITDKAIYEAINHYTREAGVRELERVMANICRKLARKEAEGGKKKIRIGVKEVRKLLGVPKYSSVLAGKKDEVGTATGLAWTQSGGEILFIEAAIMPGKSRLNLTGHLGNVMKESCHAALSYVRSHWREFSIPEDFVKKIDIHIHVPEGAVKKDGPSAGVAIVTALVSALTKIPVRKDVGVSGEITLRGKVLEVGGIKEKVIAAHQAGIKKVVLPKENKKNLEDIPSSVKKDLEIVFAETIDDVLAVALTKKLAPRGKKKIDGGKIRTSSRPVMAA